MISNFAIAGDKYAKRMEGNLKELYAAQTIEELQTVANKFDRISSVEKAEWLPGYYGSLAYVWMATREEDLAQKDKWLDQAQTLIDNAKTVNDTHSEIAALQGFIYMIALTVDPASRGQVYGPKASAEFGKAVGIDPQNPRALFFKGQMEFGTAQFFKMDTTPACDTMAKSLELFNKFTPETAIHPNWGENFTKRTVENCQVDKVVNDND